MPQTPKIFISTYPFGAADPEPLALMGKSGFEFVINPEKRKLKPEEVGEWAKDCDGLIAGTENIDIVLKTAKNLKMISRVGIGLDSVPLSECRERGITVSYTPDAVSMAVVEMTIGMMIMGTRRVVEADRELRAGGWSRLQGKRLEHSVLGFIGFGRIGSKIAQLLVPFNPQEVLINDLKDKSAEIEALKAAGMNIRQVAKEEIYRSSDIISLHVPLSQSTRNLITKEVFDQMKPDSYLINLARGGIVNEDALYTVLEDKKILGAAIDVFDEEPYRGPLLKLDNIILSQHMGSCSFDCRKGMEVQATEDMIRFFKNEPLASEVPDEEYAYQG